MDTIVLKVRPNMTPFLFRTSVETFLKKLEEKENSLKITSHEEQNDAQCHQYKSS